MVRASAQRDLQSIRRIYPSAFPDEDLPDLVTDLLGRDDVLSLVAEAAGEVIGHVLFTPGRIGIQGTPAALLGPLAVVPDRQRQGIGSALVRTGLDRLEQKDVGAVCVLGNPAYYGRFGFLPATGVEPPCPIPANWKAAWQIRTRRPDTPQPCGRLCLPGPWLRSDLWTG